MINAYDAYDPRGIRTSKYMKFLGEYYAKSEHEARRMCILHMHTLSRFVKDLELNAV